MFLAFFSTQSKVIMKGDEHACMGSLLHLFRH